MIACGVGTLVILLLAQMPAALAQESQTWATARVHAPLSDDYKLKLRYRARHSDFFDERSLYHVRVILNRTLNSGSQLGVGYERFPSSSGTLEHRYFPQLTFHSSLLGIELEQRLRLELRDIRAFDKEVYRLRYRLQHTRSLGDSPVYIELGNEVFFSASEVEGLLDRGFNQNRIGGALGFRMSRRARLELGYQWAYVDSGIVTRADHIFQLDFTWGNQY